MTGQDLYFLHRQAQVRLGMTVKEGYASYRQPLHWHELDEKHRQAWEDTARHANERYESERQAARQAVSPHCDLHCLTECGPCFNQRMATSGKA